MSEQNKDIINQIVNKLHSELDLENIYLFGSYAWGNPSNDSDIDLFIVMESRNMSNINKSREAYKALRNIDISIPIDILVRTKEEVNNAENNSLIHKIINDGLLLYEK